MSRARGATVRACLKAIGVQAEDLAGCENVEQQWSAVKKSYFKNILSSHPDKVRAHHPSPACLAWMPHAAI